MKLCCHDESDRRLGSRPSASLGPARSNPQLMTSQRSCSFVFNLQQYMAWSCAMMVALTKQALVKLVHQGERYTGHQSGLSCEEGLA